MLFFGEDACPLSSKSFNREISRGIKKTLNKIESLSMEVYETLGTNGTAYSISSLELFQCIGF